MQSYAPEAQAPVQDLPQQVGEIQASVYTGSAAASHTQDQEWYNV